MRLALIAVGLLAVAGCRHNNDDGRSQPWHDRLYREGEWAREERVPAAANPCLGDPEKARCWLRGWIQQKMREEGRLRAFSVREIK